MGYKNTAGLQLKANGIWCIDKYVWGKRICESTKTRDLVQAEAYYLKRAEELRQSVLFGVRPQRKFEVAAKKYLRENQHKKTIADDEMRLRGVLSHVGHLPLEAVHMGNLQDYIAKRRKDGVKTNTINHGLQVVRRVLNLAAGEWIDDNGLTWLHAAPKIKLLPARDMKRPYPLTWDEQVKLFDVLPDHLRNMAVFAVNTGLREGNILRLRWAWEMEVTQECGGRVFIVPGDDTKNGEDLLVVINQIARTVIESQRGKHPEYVFTYHNRSLTGMNNTAWDTARTKVGLSHLRVHDLRHTFGSRLRSAGVSFEDRQDLLGHRSGRITTHYSMAELENLYQAANKLCDRKKSGLILRMVYQKAA